MAKHWSATSLVAVALLICKIGPSYTQFQAHPQPYPFPQPGIPQNPQPPKVYPVPQPGIPQNPQPPKVYPVPQPGIPQNPQPPKVFPFPQPGIPQNLQPPKAYPVPQPGIPQNPQPPKAYPFPQPGIPQNPQPPKAYPFPQPGIPQNPQPPKVYPVPQPGIPQNPQPPKGYPFPQPGIPQNPQPPKVYPFPQPGIPQNPQPPKVYPGQQPGIPQNPQPPKAYPGQQPGIPQNPQPPKAYPGQQPGIPQNPQPPKAYPGQQPGIPQNPQPPKAYPGQQPAYPQNPQSAHARPAQPSFNQFLQPPKVRPALQSKYPYPRGLGGFPQNPTIPKPQQPQQPNQPQQPQQPNQPQQPHQPQQPQTPNVDGCEVETNVRIPCGSPDLSAAGCEAINCCFDGRQCYYGKAVTIQCTKDAQFIVVVARDATLPFIDLDTISMLGAGQGCTHVDSNSAFAIYQFPVTGCGSVVMEEPGVIIYENQMSSSFEVGIGSKGVITRDSSFQLLFQCRYIGTSVETVVVEVFPIQNPVPIVSDFGPIRVALELANGQCYEKGCHEIAEVWNSFYTEADYPVTKVLRDPVYVQVQLLEKTDPNLVLSLGHCWTTTTPNPHSLPQWDLLIDGCPYSDDRYLTLLVPVAHPSGQALHINHIRRFIFKMFAFVDNSFQTLNEQVFIHCSTAVCTPANGHSCEPSCFRKRRDVEDTYQTKADPKVVVSVGPVNMVSQ